MDLGTPKLEEFLQSASILRRRMLHSTKGTKMGGGHLGKTPCPCKCHPQHPVGLQYYVKRTRIIMKKALWLGFMLIGFWSCKKPPNTAVFLGGQIVKPSSSFVSVYFGNRVLDTFLLKSATRFSRKYDSLPPGIYKMEHIPEFTSILLEPGDSLWVRINAAAFHYNEANNA